MARGTATATVSSERNIFQRLFWPEDPSTYSAGFSRPQDYERAITAIINRVDNRRTPFRWRVFLVAALGFFTDSYNLFASNVVLPALSYIYWGSSSRGYVFGFNVATLIGSICGQIAFGVVADIYGRRSLYGVELMIVIISTIGLLQCSNGYFDAETNTSTWGITPWLFFWRVVMGIGIGAEYPLSACIAAEWSSRHSRARMMSAVFLMQPLGQLLAYVVGIIAIGKLSNSRSDLDKFWRIVIGVGAAPTILALIARPLIPESWRFTYFVSKNPSKASKDSRDLYDRDAVMPSNNGNTSEAQSLDHDSVLDGEHESPATAATAAWRPGSQFEWKSFRSFLWSYRARLSGTSLTWLLLDVAFYGMGFNSPNTLAKLWTSRPIYFDPAAPWWQTNSDVTTPNTTGIVSINGVLTTAPIANPSITDVLGSTMRHAIYTTSIAAILGGVVFVGTAHLLNRRHMLIGTFFALSALLAITAGALRTLFHDGIQAGAVVPGGHVVLIFLWALTQFFFSFGPNTLTFIIPAEIFPTRYRCTSYGIAAASGKLGAVIVQVVIWVTPNDPNNYTTLQWLLAAFSVCMAIGGLIALSPSAIPHVQDGLVNGSLEELSDDRDFIRMPAATEQHD